MDSLQDWYRYLDEVSRPARKCEDEELVPWRPWSPGHAAGEPPAETSGSASGAEHGVAVLPSLGSALGRAGVPAILHGASREFEDPTRYDELGPLPEYFFPEMTAPRFEVSIPSLAGSLAGGAGNGLESAAAPAAEEKATAGGADPAVGEAVARQRLELLRQIRSHSDGPRGRPGQARAAMVERLLDPTLTLEETALMLGVCPTTVRRYTNRNQLRHFRTQGNQRRFRLSDVLEFLDRPGPDADPDPRPERETDES